MLFDIEQYDGLLFDYRKQRDAKTKSWEVYAAQVRQRGREVMEAFQDGYPGLTVFLTFCYSLPWLESASGRGALAECHYGLLAPFMDGLVDAAETRRWMEWMDANQVSSASWSLVDKAETAAALVPGAPDAGWSDAQLTPSGALAKAYISAAPR